MASEKISNICFRLRCQLEDKLCCAKASCFLSGFLFANWGRATLDLDWLSTARLGDAAATQQIETIEIVLQN